MKNCPVCNTHNGNQSNYCRVCGNLLSLASVSALPKENRYCSRCGNPVSLSAKFCRTCSQPLSVQLINNTPAQLVLPNQNIQSTRSSSQNNLFNIATGKIKPGKTVGGRYTILRLLGAGGMGAVYLVTDSHLASHPMALKEMSDSALITPEEKQKAYKAFEHEAQLLSKLSHPFLPRVTDFFSEDGKPFLIMDYVPGETLSKLLENCSKPFDEAIVLKWAEQICEVLGYLHSLNPPVIFRDLKPGNVMISPDNKTARLIDFGIARIFKVGATKDTAKLGTPGYAPPEQFGKNQTDERSDIYALGAMLHQLLTLRDPGIQIFSFPPVSSINPNVSQRVSMAIQKAVSNNPDQRWQTAQEFWKALSKPLANHPRQSPQHTNLPPTSIVPSRVPITPPPMMQLPTQSYSMQVSRVPNVQIAPHGDRIKAIIIDGFILGIINFLISLIVAEIYNQNTNYNYIDYSGLVIAPIIITLCYYTWFHSRSGQTIGKRISNLRVVRSDGDKLGFLQALWRGVIYLAPAWLIFIPDLQFIGIFVYMLIWITPLVNSKHRALHDYLAGTTVIQE